MSGRKAMIGLSLICALAFCAFGAANASANEGTTAFTCVENGGKKDFEDAHCDKQKLVGGTFGHVEIAPGTPTEIHGSNNTTGSSISSWILNSKIAAVEIEITCETATTEKTTLTNNPGPPMNVTGSGILKLGNCKLLKPTSQTAKCTVTVAPTESNSTTVTKSMEIKFSPTGANFTEVTIGGAECNATLKGTFPVKGTAGATGTGGAATEPLWYGATLKFDTEMTGKTLTFAGNEAKLEGSLTFKMGKPESLGNPITYTTTTP